MKLKIKYKVKCMGVCKLLLLLFMSTLLMCFSGCTKKGVLKEVEGMVFIAPGKFIIGSNEEDINLLGKDFGSRDGKFYGNEKPERVIELNGFFVDKFEVTNKDYKLFIAATGREAPPNWEEGTFPEDRGMHPVNAVSWFDASDYCRWVGKKLPTEEEWEKAARGPSGNIYPWGNVYDEKKTNVNKGDTLLIGSMPEDRSYYGVYDMGGNVTEWTDSWYKPYPGSSLKSKYFGEIYKVVKGGAGGVAGHYSLGSIYSRSSFREYYLPEGKGVDVGFRCAKEVETK